MNYLDFPNGFDTTHLDVSNFFEDDGKINNLIGDGNVHTNLLFSFNILSHYNKYFYFDMFYLHLK